MKKYFKIFLISILFFALNAKAQTEYDVAPKEFIKAVPNSADYRVKSKEDTSGGIKLSLSGMGLADTAAFWALYHMKPGDYEKKIGWKFGAIDPCMYRSMVSVDKETLNNVNSGNVDSTLCAKFDEVTYLNPTEAPKTFLALNNTINQNIFSSLKFSSIKSSLIPDAVAQESSNCGQIYSSFLSGKTKGDSISASLDICTYHCKTPMIINDKYLDACGVNDCVSKFTKEGKISQWCSFVAENLNSGFGESSPLSAVYKKINTIENKREFFGNCVADWINNNSASEECCKYAGKMGEYNKQAGEGFSKYCSNKKSSDICFSEYKSKGKIHPACCNVANYFGGAKNIPSVRGNLEREVTFGKNLELSCKKFSKTNYSSFNNCVKIYKESNGQKITEDCCKAYAIGVLTPTSDGIDYSKVISFCK